MKNKVLQSPYRPLVIISAAAVLLLVITCSSLFAQQKPSPILQSYCYPPALSAAADARDLLPVISRPPSTTQLPLPPGVALGIIGPLPGEPESTPYPDESKMVYGYGGPYYNTTNLDGRVTVLDQSVYTWPISTWKATGMLRNQTRCSIRVIGVTVRLLGTRGDLLATVTTSVPVPELRPGEPGPFVIEAPIVREEVKSIDWHVDFYPAPTPSRMFTFEVYSAQASTDARYDLVGSIRNEAATVQPTRMVVAWLDRQNRGKILYVASPKLESSESLELVDTFDLPPDHSIHFFYVNKDPAIVPVLGKATFALWGISE